MFVDTHAHIYTEAFDEDLDNILKSAQGHQIRHIFMPNIDVSSIPSLHVVEEKYPFCHAMMGLHPCHVLDNWQEELASIKEWAFKRPYAAIGEIGIDLYWDKTFAREQEIAFRQQIGWALELALPVIIHSRDSLDLTIDIVSEYATDGFTGIFHCFNGTLEQAEKIIKNNFYLGIGGVLTYKNAGVDKVVENLPLSSMVLETDSPYLSPVPFRGKRNEPVYLNEVAIKLASLHQMSVEEIAFVTTNNAKKIFSRTTF